MEHILISPGKLKLMLTKDDLEKYEIDCDGDSELMRLAFRELLSDAERISGFDAGADKLFIQLYPSKDGGAEVYITKLGEGKLPQEDVGDTVKLTGIGLFDSMTALLGCCKSLSTAGRSYKSSSAWQDGGKYYLTLEQNVSYNDYLRGKATTPIEDIISEYGRNICKTTAMSYIHEHCLCFCRENAIERLAEMA